MGDCNENKITEGAIYLCTKGDSPGIWNSVASGPKVNKKRAVLKDDIEGNPELINCRNCLEKGSLCSDIPKLITITNLTGVKTTYGVDYLGMKAKLSCDVGGEIEFLTSGQVPLQDSRLSILKNSPEDQIRTALANPDRNPTMISDNAREALSDLNYFTIDKLGSAIHPSGGYYLTLSLAETQYLFGNKEAKEYADEQVKEYILGDIEESFKGEFLNAYTNNAKIFRLDASDILGAYSTTNDLNDIWDKFNSKDPDKIKPISSKEFQDLKSDFNKMESIMKQAKNIEVEKICFAPDTKIFTYQNNYIKIKDIKPGDLIISSECITEVIDVTCRETYKIVKLLLKNKEIIESSPSHPFYTNLGWLEANKLENNMLVRDYDGNYVKILQSEIIEYNTPIKVYNLILDGNANDFFVGSSKIMVSCKCNI